MYEQLFAADLNKSKRKGGKHAFIADAWLPSDAIRGELAESWKWQGRPASRRSQVAQRSDVPRKPGVMKARELVADDVVYQLHPLGWQPEENAQLLRPRGESRSYRQAHRALHLQELQRRVGLPLWLRILLRHRAQGSERCGAGNWKNANGTGPFHARGLRAGQRHDLRQEPELLGQGEDRRPELQAAFVDKIIYRTIKDEASWSPRCAQPSSTYWRAIRWSAVDELKKSAPALKWRSGWTRPAPSSPCA